ncbi:CidA/LrgA family protein [Deinococcus puniceus]|uniref:Murein hydrolase transporter LrgA n=1 Tax=Deinococcus puniceus TaxID=1182568 RepID=A0A172TAQ7_9DEIO|nr:CidA/LrgA family protein [Deinococcus puniceus]ANE44081.1 murein hydrolase transporter LrgA [Deinococcus puniceus]
MTSQTAALPPAVRVVLGLGVLVGFAALGEGLMRLLHWPLPGSVVGMVLLLLALGSRVVRLHWIEPAADGLLGILGLLFVPATVGAIQFLGAGAEWGLWLLVMVAGLLLGAGVAGWLAGRLVRD